MKNILILELKSIIKRLENDECGLDDENIVELANFIMHVKLNKTLAAEYLKISTRTFDRRIESGELPQGRRDIGSNQLYWYKNEL